VRGEVAFERLMQLGGFKTVLDVGTGHGDAARRFNQAGKTVTAIDLNPAPELFDGIEYVQGDFTGTYPFQGARQFDLVWCSHTLEHQPDTQTALDRLVFFTKEGGLLAITVPPLKPEIVGGHVSLWNPGLLLYRMVLAGLDCREARMCFSGYDISAIVRKREVDLPDMSNGNGDLAALKPWLPAGLKWKSADEFMGEFERLNW